MRVSCIFVTVAVMLAEQSNALPILGLGSEGHLVNSLTNTLDRVPITGGLTSDLLGSDDNTQLGESSHELLNTDGDLKQISGHLLRREGIPLVSTLGSVLNGVQSLPVLGSVGSIAPVSKGLTSEIGSAGHAGSLLRREGIPLISTLGSVLNGAQSLPVLGSVGSILPVSKGLTSNIGSVGGDLPAGSLLRRQGLPLVNTLGSVLNGVETLPVLGSVGSIAPVSKGLTSNIGSVNGALPDVKKVASATTHVLPAHAQIPSLAPVTQGLTSEIGSVGVAGDLPVAGTLLRRQGIPLVNTLGSVLIGVETLPVLGSVGSIAPVSKGLTTNIGSVNGALPDVNKVASTTAHVLPASTLHAQIPSIIKREGSFPVIGTLPVVSSIPGLKEIGSLPGLNAIPTFDSLPGYDNLQVLDSVPGISHLETLADAVPETGLTRRSGMDSWEAEGLTKRGSGIPFIGSLPLVGQLPGVTNLPGISSVPGLGSLPSVASLYPLGSLPLTDGASGLSGVKSLTSTLPIPSIF